MKLILHTEILGNGEPLLFLHTGLQRGMTDFQFQREYFKDRYQIILPDLRGHGQSVHDDFSAFFEDSAQDLSETLSHLGVDSAHIAGCSLGALAGLFFAKRFPSKVKSLTLSGILSEQPDNWLDMQKEDIAHQAQLLKNEEAIRYFDALHKSDWRQFLELAKNDDWYPFEVTKDLEGITSPVLIMVGEGNKAETKGTLFYPSIKEDVHVSIIPFASHLVHSQQPEIYTKILEAFLNKVHS
ncbi:alpha/beta fold hydrolase [Peribacillus sp. SCS-26]|uniref:alpha/beta fold hydrolase n=1 Tax=Paraperibacillus marinus TaxID=3115295 RepID=UPI0039069A19